MRQIDGPISTPRPWKKGEAITEAKLNEVVNIATRNNTGISNPSQKMPNFKTGALPIYCRVVVDDAAIPLSGLPEVDGLTDLAEDDLALVTLDSAVDGVYKIKAGGPWFRVGRLSRNHGTDKAPVYPPGIIISVYDGDSAPQAFMHTIDNTLENI